MVTDQQVRRLRQKLMEKKTQEAAAAAAGMSVRTARSWQSGILPSEKKKARHWRTRPDPFEEIWDEEVEPLLERDPNGILRATIILEKLQERYPGKFSPGQVRTLQRRLKDWRAVNGPDREVYFPQEHPPGREAQAGMHDRAGFRQKLRGSRECKRVCGDLPGGKGHVHSGSREALLA